MRLQNAEQILQSVRLHQEASRAEIARETGLSPATVSSIVEDLLKLRFLSETGSRTTALGRRPIGLAFNSSSVHFAGISLNNRNELFVALMDLEKNPICTKRIPLASDNKISGTALSESLLLALKAACKAGSVNFQSIASLGLSMPGPIRNEIEPGEGETGDLESVYRNAANLTARKLLIPVSLNSLVNTAALHESRQAEGNSCLVYLRAGHALRSAVLYDGKILGGKNNLAGEIGHLILPDKTWSSFGGKQGCINGILALPAFLEQCRLAGLELATEDQFVDALQNNSFLTLLAEAATALAYATAALINTLAPDAVIISAPYLNCGLAFKEPFERALAHYAEAELLRQSKIQFRQSKDSSESEAYGAALMAMQDFSLLGHLKSQFEV